MSRQIFEAARRAAMVLGASALVGLAAPACQAPAGERREGLAEVQSEGKVGGCQCVSSGTCGQMSYSDVPADGKYYLTSYGGGSETQPQSCPGTKMADGTWAYIADRARFGCGAKVKIEANGKSCVAQVADCGPNRCVEEAAAYNSCGSHFPIIDASPLITKHLFGTSSGGYSDKYLVKATEVAISTPIGCGAGGGSGGSGGAGGGGKGGAGGKGGSGGSGGENECEKDTDCGGASAKCDKSSTPWRCVNRKEIGEACGSDQECHGGLSGTQRICEGGVCTDACRKEFDCVAPGKCDIKEGKTTGSCKGSGCLLEYPSVSILGIPAPPRVTQSYKGRGCEKDTPACVIDINNIIDAKSKKKLSYKMVKLSDHFTLSEMTHQSAASSPYVYVDPEFIKRLEAARQAYGSSIHVNSGFRSPIHQDKVCRGICGKASCPRKCAMCSNHMGGQAADLTHSSPKCSLGKKSCDPGQMHLIFNEQAGGDHLHVDIGKINGVCSYKGFSCK